MPVAWTDPHGAWMEWIQPKPNAGVVSVY